ncbi:sigma-70 family RNA polymerase sigma factor [Myxococcus stipitatus]|uniref:RNA polymerase sigma factor n=1 Tax=Myxococcus stipitatus TaxID=83455 RepID=UPI001F3195B1|nr:sigma-70 family RNA polymerase sigma factor [Myxococcus stipitatus]MCE9667059.1 sigma-70 family RNA polymerase sigma factor [Myxococcus stipitatus]
MVELYRRHCGLAYRRALRLLRNADEARDVTQDAFVSLMARWEQLDTPGETASLLYEVATCLAIDRIRSQRKRAHLQMPLRANAAAAFPWELATQEGHARVDAARDLAVLTRGESPRALSIAVLHFVEGRSMTEVGEALSLSPKTVRRMLTRFVNRARKRCSRLDGPVMVSPEG